MVVSDKKKSIDKANEISTLLLDIIGKEVGKFECTDDPTENIYLSLHTICILNVKLCISLEKYSNTYGINSINKERFSEWIQEITKEYLKDYKEKMDD